MTGWRSQTLLVVILLLAAPGPAGAESREPVQGAAASGTCLEPVTLAQAGVRGSDTSFPSQNDRRCCCIDFAGNLCCIKRDKEYGCIGLRQYCFCRPPRPGGGRD